MMPTSNVSQSGPKSIASHDHKDMADGKVCPL